MVRDVAFLGAAMMALQVACPYALGAPVGKADVHHAQPKQHKVVASTHGAASPRGGAATHSAIALHAATPHLVSLHTTVSLHAPASLHPAAAPHTATANTRTASRHMAHVTAEAEPEEAAVQLPAPEVDTADGVPTPLAFHVSTGMLAPQPDGRRDTADLTADVPVLPSTPPVLTSQESDAGQMANAQGDTTFLMVDKARGRIILFENGQPVFAGPALTGQSTADEMPKTELTANFDTLNAPNTKITPAGRYTVQRGFDPEVGGPLFDIHEIRGKDWGIAIHQLYLGIPSEHRDVRIMSPSAEDKHITYGCINISTPSMQVLLHELPGKTLIPLYILPEDASQTAAYLTPRTSS
jgi:hypothetical protein